jgi:broad-specificity NMP kinase
MFQNREFRIRAVKLNKKQIANDIETLEESFTIDPEKVAEAAKDVMSHGHALTKDLVKHTAKAAAAVIVLTVVASTIGDVITNSTKQN